MHKNQRGNILFLILLAVVLFAALSYAVTSSMRGGGKNATDEQMQTAFSQIHNFTSLGRATLTRMVMTGGLNASQLDPQVSPFSSHINGNCTSNSCYIYHPDGGGLNEFVLENKAALMAGTASSTSYIRLMPVANIGTGSYEYVFYLPGISPEFCEFYNSKISGPSGTSASYNYAGTGSSAINTTNIAANAAFAASLGGNSASVPIRSMDTACYYNTNAANAGGTGHVIFAVLLER